MSLLPKQLEKIKEYYHDEFKDKPGSNETKFTSFDKFTKYCKSQYSGYTPDIDDYLEVYFAAHPIIISQLNNVVEATGSKDISRIFDSLSDEDLNKILQITEPDTTNEINKLISPNMDISTATPEEIKKALDAIEHIYLTHAALLYQYLLKNQENKELKDRFKTAIISNYEKASLKPNTTIDVHSSLDEKIKEQLPLYFAVACMTPVLSIIFINISNTSTSVIELNRKATLNAINAKVGTRYANKDDAAAALERERRTSKAASWKKSAIATGAIAVAISIGIALLATGVIAFAPITMPIAIGACVIAAAASLVSFIVNRVFTKRAKIAQANLAALPKDPSQSGSKSNSHDKNKTTEYKKVVSDNVVNVNEPVLEPKEKQITNQQSTNSNAEKPKLS